MATAGSQRPDNSSEAGVRLRRARESLDLTFRDVQEASRVIADRHDNQDFVVLISRLSEIESHGTLPSIYRLYSLCCIYRLNLNEVLSWFGVGTSSMAADAGSINLRKTHLVRFDPDSEAEAFLPISLNPGIDLTRTFFLSEVVQRWGKLPLALVGGADVRRYRYAFVGTEDWAMHPTIPAGALLVIDDTKRRIQTTGWTSLAERPIYLLEHRDAFYARWCSLQAGNLSLIPDPSSEAAVETFRFPGEIDVLGEVVGLAITLDPERRRRSRHGAAPEPTRGR